MVPKNKWHDPFTVNAPPTKKRKITEADTRHSDEEWEEWRPRIEYLYRQQTLGEVCEELKEVGFKVSPRQLRIRIEGWEGNSKYTKLSNLQWKYIEYRVMRRLVECPQKRTAVRFKGAIVPVPKKNLQRNMKKRLETRMLSDGISISGSISSHGISIYTSNTHGIDLQIFKCKEAPPPVSTEAMPAEVWNVKRWSSLRWPSSSGDPYEIMLWQCVHETSKLNPRDQFALEVSECLYGGYCFNLKCRDCPQYRFKSEKPLPLQLRLTDQPLIMRLLENFRALHLDDEQHKTMVDLRYNEEARKNELRPTSTSRLPIPKIIQPLIDDNPVHNETSLKDNNMENLDNQDILCECMSIWNHTTFGWPEFTDLNEENMDTDLVAGAADIEALEGPRDEVVEYDEAVGENYDTDNIVPDQDTSNEFLESWLQNIKQYELPKDMILLESRPPEAANTSNQAPTYAEPLTNITSHMFTCPDLNFKPLSRQEIINTSYNESVAAFKRLNDDSQKNNHQVLEFSDLSVVEDHADGLQAEGSPLGTYPHEKRGVILNAPKFFVGDDLGPGEFDINAVDHPSIKGLIRPVDSARPEKNIPWSICEVAFREMETGSAGDTGVGEVDGPAPDDPALDIAFLQGDNAPKLNDLCTSWALDWVELEERGLIEKTTRSTQPILTSKSHDPDDDLGLLDWVKSLPPLY